MFQGIMVFSEGEIVGRVTEFGTAEEFLANARDEYPDTYDLVEVGNVGRVFIRFYNHPPEGVMDDFPDGCYSFCDKPGRGAFECFAFDTRRFGES